MGKIECKSIFDIDKRSMGGKFSLAGLFEVGAKIDPKRMQNISYKAQRIDEWQKEKCEALREKGLKTKDKEYLDFLEKRGKIHDLTLALELSLDYGEKNPKKLIYAEKVMNELFNRLGLDSSSSTSSPNVADKNFDEENEKIRNMASYIESIIENQIIIGNVFEKTHIETIEGDIAFKTKNYDMALEIYENYLKLKPQTVSVLNKLGQTYFHMGRFKDAKECYEKIHKIDDKNDNALVMLGLQLFLLNLDKKMKIIDFLDNMYKEALKINGDNALAYYFQAANACWKGKKEDGISKLAKALQLDPKLKVLYKKHDSLDGKPFESIRDEERIKKLF